MESSIRVEFAVKIHGKDDVGKIDQALKAKGLSVASADLEGKTVLVELNPSKWPLEDNINALQQHIENQTGFVTVVKGLGHLGSAVAELGPPTTSDSIKSVAQQPPIGVVRLSQLAERHCYVDGQVDRLGSQRRLLSLAVHEYGDLGGKNFNSIGQPIIELEARTPAENCLLVKKVIPDCDVASLIGRSVALTEHLNDDKQLPKQHHVILSAGVIARASVVGANKKQVCTCSGKTLWEERLDMRQNKSPN